MADGTSSGGAAVRVVALAIAASLALAAGPLPAAAAGARGAERVSTGQQATAVGACGSATLTVWPGPWSGVATIALRVSSAWGPIVGASWSVRWQNATSGQNGSYGGGQLVLSDVLTRSDALYTGRGTVTVWLASLDVVLWWGAHCRGLGPLDQTWIP